MRYGGYPVYTYNTSTSNSYVATYPAYTYTYGTSNTTANTAVSNMRVDCSGVTWVTDEMLKKEREAAEARKEREAAHEAEMMEAFDEVFA